MVIERHNCFEKYSFSADNNWKSMKFFANKIYKQQKNEHAKIDKAKNKFRVQVNKFSCVIWFGF